MQAPDVQHDFGAHLVEIGDVVGGFVAGAQRPDELVSPPANGANDVLRHAVVTQCAPDRLDPAGQRGLPTNRPPQTASNNSIFVTTRWWCFTSCVSTSNTWGSTGTETPFRRSS